MKFNSLAEIRAHNESAGYHFFDTSSMRYFDSRVHTLRRYKKRISLSSDGIVVGGKYFITSEQFHGSNGHRSPRMFTVRVITPDANIETIGTFNEIKTIQEAVAAIPKN